jgi:hypothetical protein
MLVAAVFVRITDKREGLLILKEERYEDLSSVDIR